MNGQAGKGDKYRPTNKQKYDVEYERIFGKKCRFPHKHTRECAGYENTDLNEGKT